MKNIFIYIILLVALISSCDSKYVDKIFLTDWKFKTGDSSQWSKSEFDDTQWSRISIDTLWEYQGYKDYDGIAWYRTKIFIPSSFKENAYMKDSVQIYLSTIDDGDQLFLNGKFIGQNNKHYATPPNDSVFKKETLWDKSRVYTIASNEILWDKENVIAIRVIDLTGDGGLHMGIPTISMVDLKNYLVIDKFSGYYEFSNNKVVKTFILYNHSNVILKGKLIVEVLDDENQKTLFNTEKVVIIEPGKSMDFPISFKPISNPCITHLTFKHSGSKIVLRSEDEVPYILTPKPKDTPNINGPKVTGARPGNDFLFLIPATGIRPMTFNVINLPSGLALDSKTGIISGKVLTKGNYLIKLIAKNSLGQDQKELTIAVGDKLALTPPLGWNSWNCWGLSVDQDKIIQSAHAFVKKGLVNHGWSFINIDDGWEGNRDATGEILPNEKFPDMKALGDTLHKLGLKFGIYSSPGLLTCGGHTGSYQHEQQDVITYAKWGVDYLKYDWCSYWGINKDESVSEMKKPYGIMQKALAKVDRDIVYSICQYNMADVHEWGEEVGGNLWRISGDIVDTWESMSSIGFSQIDNAKAAGPGHWNDPDMMVVGFVGWSSNLHPARLTVNEQYTHVSLWSLLSAPLLIGCDLNRLDEFTLNLLTNDEVLAIDQDILGRQALPVIRKKDYQVWVKELEDGNKAVGIFNLDLQKREIEINWKDLGIHENQNVRDVWRQKDLGFFKDKFKSKIPPHGVILIKVTPN